MVKIQQYSMDKLLNYLIPKGTIYPRFCLIESNIFNPSCKSFNQILNIWSLCICSPIHCYDADKQIGPKGSVISYSIVIPSSVTIIIKIPDLAEIMVQLSSYINVYYRRYSISTTPRASRDAAASVVWAIRLKARLLRMKSVLSLEPWSVMTTVAPLSEQ